MIYHIPTCICHVCSSFIHLSFYSFKFFSDLEIQPHLLWVVFVSATKQEKEYKEISLVKHKTQTINSSNQSEFDCKFIIWLNLWVGKINKILYSDWLLGPTRRKKVLLTIQHILHWSWARSLSYHGWNGSCSFLFWCFNWPWLCLGPKTECGQSPAISNSPLVK